MEHSKKLPKLDPDLALGELCKRHFYRFFLEFWETIEAVELIPNWHIEYICDQLQDVYEKWARKESQDDVLINVPPGSSKSTIVTQLFPAWLWVQNKSIRVISSSYAGDLATAHAVKTRDCLKSDKFQRCYPGLIEFKEDTDGKTHYKNTDMGERFTTSTRGRVTGVHADFILIDDPISPEEAASLADLKRVSRFVSQTLSARKVDKNRTVTIMVMQRLHESDPAGEWISKKPLRHICLPGEITEGGNHNVKPAELIERYQDGLLDVNRLDRVALAKLKTNLGSYGYAGQIGQRPAPEGGGIWQKWFVPIPDNAFPNPEDMQDYGSDWDTAYTAEQKNDASAYCTSGKIGGNIYIDKLGFAKLELPALIRYMDLRPAPHYIEAKASGKSAKQVLADAGVVAIEVPVNGGDKIARTKFATPPVEAGMVFIRARLLDMLYNDPEQGLLFFPNGKHDDLNDAVVQAIQRHSKKKRAFLIG